MKSFLRNVVQRKESSGGGLVGRTVKVGPYTIRVEAHLADGGFASIYKVRDGSTGTAYALKHMRLMGDHEAIADCMTEVHTLKRLREVPSIVTLRAAAFTGAKGSEQEAYLILDLCKDNLVEYMRALDNKLSTATILQIFSAICQAVAAMHQQQPALAHRDLKAENVLQHMNGDWVLCDFGSVTDKPALYQSSDAVLMGEEIIRKYTTPAYRSPEMWDLYSRECIDTKADIWALGCLLYYLMFGKLAFQAEAKLQILNGEFSVPPTRPPPLILLLRQLLVVNPVQRPDIVTVLRRLQEVADALSVDPALLVPHGPPPVSREEAQPAGPVLTQQSPVPLPFPAAPLGPPASDSMPAAVPLGAALAHRSSSFTRTATPPLSSVPSTPSLSPPEVQGFAQFDSAAPLFSGRGSDMDVKAPQSSPPRSQRSLLIRQQRESSLSSAEAASFSGSGEAAALRKQVAELQSQNQQLQSTVKSQQNTIKQLQVDNYNQVLQLKRLGLDPVPSVVSVSAPSMTPEPGWASFDSPPADGANLAPVRTPSFHSQDGLNSDRGSPHRQSGRLSNGGISRARSPQPFGSSAGFDAFGIQAGATTPAGLASPSTDPGSANDTPSETMSRQSALSAFAESLKQPALAEVDGDSGSPLSDCKPQDITKPQKQSKRSHRRSSSEPVPIEAWNLVEEH